MENKRPAFAEITPVQIDGDSYNRLMIALKTSGCVHALSDSGGCTFCGFKELTSKGVSISAENLVGQFFDGILKFDIKTNNIAEIDIYNSGSFLSDREVPPQAREAIFKMASSLEIKKIFIESRPEFIIDNKSELIKLKKLWGDRIFELGMGLETADDRLRQEQMNKGFSYDDFCRAAEILAELNIDLLAYVFFKPPSLTEREAIEDSVNTIHKLSELTEKFNLNIKAALQPAFVAKGTALEKLYLEGKYQTPNLWSVVEIIKRTAYLPVDLQVGLSDEGLSEGRVAYSCLKCYDSIISALRQFNSSGVLDDISAIQSLSCECLKIEDL